MKILLCSLAALLASAAVAQPAPVPDPPAATSPVADPAAEIAPPSTPVLLLVEKNGVWWNGDRKATPDEITAYKRSRPQ